MTSTGADADKIEGDTLRTSVLCAIAAIVSIALASQALIGPAFADIASFNAAVKAADFKRAAAEAAATWPQLDKSREDIALIAREFGFAAFMAQDFPAAKTYSEFSTRRAAPGPDGALSTVLLRLSEHRIKSSPATRENLNQALSARREFPGFDVISFLGAESLIAYDLERGKWKNAQASTALAMGMSGSGGPAYLFQHRRFSLYSAISDYRVSEEPVVYDQLTELRRNMIEDIDAAASEEAARRFVPLYWEATAWQETINAHLHAIGKKIGSECCEAEMLNTDGTERRKRLLHQHALFDSCQRRMVLRPHPTYPDSALYRGFVGSVVLQVDIDASGKAINPEVLAAVPEKYFGKSAVDSVKNMKFEKSAMWNDASCSMTETGHVVIFKFMIPNR